MLVQTSVDDAASDRADPIAETRQGAGLGLVLDLPRPVGRPSCAPHAEAHFGVVAQLNHPLQVVDGPAAPAFRAIRGGVVSNGEHLHQVPGALAAVSGGRQRFRNSRRRSSRRTAAAACPRNPGIDRSTGRHPPASSRACGPRSLGKRCRIARPGSHPERRPRSPGRSASRLAPAQPWAWGSRSRKWAPAVPSTSSTSPPWPRATLRAMARPRPLPVPRDRAASPR